MHEYILAPHVHLHLRGGVEVRWEKQEAAGSQVTHCSESHCTQQGVLGEGAVRGFCVCTVHRQEQEDALGAEADGLMLLREGTA